MEYVLELFLKLNVSKTKFETYNLINKIRQTCREIFLYLYICDMLIFYIYLTDKYKNNPYFAISIF